jgi:hypothetical protein
VTGTLNRAELAGWLGEGGCVLGGLGDWLQDEELDLKVGVLMAGAHEGVYLAVNEALELNGEATFHRVLECMTGRAYVEPLSIFEQRVLGAGEPSPQQHDHQIFLEVGPAACRAPARVFFVELDERVGDLASKPSRCLKPVCVWHETETIPGHPLGGKPNAVPASGAVGVARRAGRPRSDS